MLKSDKLVLPDNAAPVLLEIRKLLDRSKERLDRLENPTTEGDNGRGTMERG